MSEAEANGWMGNGWSWRRIMSRSWKNNVRFLYTKFDTFGWDGILNEVLASRVEEKKLLSFALNDLICSVLARGFATYISRFGRSPIFGV